MRYLIGFMFLLAGLMALPQSVSAQDGEEGEESATMASPDALRDQRGVDRDHAPEAHSGHDAKPQHGLVVGDHHAQCIATNRQDDPAQHQEPPIDSRDQQSCDDGAN